MHTRIETLGRDEYIASIATIDDSQSRRFADQALAWWDRHFSWSTQGCDVLVDEDDSHLCYIFSKTDRYNEYLTVYNLFTPQDERRNGYAQELLGLIVTRSLQHHVRRITFSSVSDSLDFYLALGFVFWGLNDIGDYYCDLPIPAQGLGGFEEMIRTLDVEGLIGKKLEKIYAKVHDNEIKLTPTQLLRYENDRLKLGSKCSFETLSTLKENSCT